MCYIGLMTQPLPWTCLAYFWHWFTYFSYGFGLQSRFPGSDVTFHRCHHGSQSPYPVGTEEREMS